MDLYTQLRGAASLNVTGSKGPTYGLKGFKKDWRYATLMSNHGPVHTSKERSFFKCHGSQYSAI